MPVVYQSGSGMEADRRDIVRTQLVVYHLLRSAGRDPLWQRAKRIGKVSSAEDPYYVVVSQLESQFQIS